MTDRKKCHTGEENLLAQIETKQRQSRFKDTRAKPNQQKQLHRQPLKWRPSLLYMLSGIPRIGPSTYWLATRLTPPVLPIGPGAADPTPEMLTNRRGSRHPLRGTPDMRVVRFRNAGESLQNFCRRVGDAPTTLE